MNITRDEVEELETAINEADYGHVRKLQALHGYDKFDAMVGKMPPYYQNELGNLRNMVLQQNYERARNLSGLIFAVGIVTVLGFMAFRAWVRYG